MRPTTTDRGRRGPRQPSSRCCASAQRTLERIARALAALELPGDWTNTFGTVDVKPADGGYKLSIDISAVYGSGSDRRRECKVAAEVKPAQGAWLTGEILPDHDAKPATDKADDKSEPQKPVSLKCGGRARPARRDRRPRVAR